MASKKAKTTFSKLAREAKLRERRVAKQQRKDARRHPPADPAGEEHELEPDESLPIGDAPAPPATGQ